ncbi:uncharacterized protein LOC130657535 [Hydractinia symbiolongicarpus]|uniref:uncharacterized protein LOC130657535 n=1 Tax=Hydractinia symbiolongicarpus TaxID=13093 RepID=UPI00254C16A0|nr:uncharacterized protein LOC130657535 [Hydractinia symbiolongicarpus]
MLVGNDNSFFSDSSTVLFFFSGSRIGVINRSIMFGSISLKAAGSRLFVDVDGIGDIDPPGRQFKVPGKDAAVGDYDVDGTFDDAVGGRVDDAIDGTGGGKVDEAIDDKGSGRVYDALDGTGGSRVDDAVGGTVDEGLKVDGIKRVYAT